MNLRCPQCSTDVTGEPGAEVVCPNCGFRATVPDAPTAPESVPPAASPAETKTETPASAPVAPTSAAMRSTWAYLLAVASVGTFFLASVGLPFALGLAALGLGGWTLRENRNDRRAQIACAIGGVGLLAALVMLSV